MVSKSRCLLVLIALFAVVVAGCLGADDAADTPSETPDGPALRSTTTYHFGDSWSLEEGTPLGDTRRAALGNFYTRWAVGSGFPEWSSSPLADAIAVHGPVEMTFWITTDTLVPSTPGIFPDFVVYFGTTAALASVVSPNNLDPVAADNTVLTPGTVLPVTATFELPPGGVIVPSGVGLRVVTAPVMMETEANELYVLYGSEEFPSNVTFDYTRLADDPAFYVEDSASAQDYVLPAGSFLHGQEVEGVNVVTIPATVEAHHTGLLVDLDFTGVTPFPDMDLYVIAPNGTIVANSVTPGADEAVHLYRDNLATIGPGEYTIKIVNYVTVRATFTVTIRTLTDAAAPADAALEA